MSKLPNRIVVFLLVIGLFGCQTPSAPGGSVDAGVDTGDAHSTPDAPDAADSPDGSSDTLSFDASLWNKPNPCQGEKSFPEDNTEFAIPDRPESNDPKVTREQIIADLGRLPLQGSFISVDPDLEPGTHRPYELFANPGTDVHLYLAVFNNYDDLSSFRLNVTTMVDYQPVEATYQRWSPDRSQMLSEIDSAGLNFPIQSDVEIVDITIPGEVFNEERMYEVSMTYEVTTIERRPVGASRRFALFNGGYNRLNRPCVEPKLDQAPTELEERLRGRISDDIAELFFEGITSREDLRRVIDVRPGETRKMYLSVIHSDLDVEPTVLVPLLNGEPLGTTWWVTQGGPRDSWRHIRIDARKSFEVTFPQEPGIYEVQVASWTDPFELYRDRTGTRIDGVSIGGGLNQNSNALRFRVVDK